MASILGKFQLVFYFLLIQKHFYSTWLSTSHALMANEGEDRRISTNAQYLAPNVKQLKYELDTAMLVHGSDKYGHFGLYVGGKSDLDSVALLKQKELDELYRKTAGQ